MVDQRMLIKEQVHSTLVSLRIDTLALKSRMSGSRLVLSGFLKKMSMRDGDKINDPKLMGTVEQALKRIKGVGCIEFQLDDPNK